MTKKVFKTLSGLLLSFLISVLVFCIAENNVYAASFTKYEVGGVTYYYVDDQQVTEEEYYDAYYDGTSKTGYITLSNGSLRWYYYGTYVENEDAYWAKKAESWGCYQIGELGTKLDGTVLWYGAYKVYYSEEEAIKGYVESDAESGGYKKSDGTYVWFWDGVILANKEEYVKKAAAYYKNGYRTIEDGSILYYCEGLPYYTERAYYEAQGYVYVETETEGMAAVDRWFNADSNLTEIDILIKGLPSVLTYYETKLESATGDALYLTYRESIMKSRRTRSGGSDDAKKVGISIAESQFGTESQIKEARAAAKKVADTLRNKSQYDQMKGAYDWLCKNIQYDYSLNNHSAYSALITKKTVCEGYTAAFQLIMEELGIDCHTVVGTNHTWNVVKYEGKWYWVDATWGDQVSYVDYTWFLCGTNKRANITSISVSATSYKNATNTPTPTPTQPSTQKPTEATTEATTEEPTEETTEETVAETTSPVEETTQAETESSTEKATEKETEASGENNTETDDEITSTIVTDDSDEAKNNQGFTIPKEVIIIATSIAVCLALGLGGYAIIYNVKKRR